MQIEGLECDAMPDAAPWLSREGILEMLPHLRPHLSSCLLCHRDRGDIARGFVSCALFIPMSFPCVSRLLKHAALQCLFHWKKNQLQLESPNQIPGLLMRRANCVAVSSGRPGRGGNPIWCCVHLRIRRCHPNWQQAGSLLMLLLLLLFIQTR